jgi:hypothetical protein
MCECCDTPQLAAGSFIDAILLGGIGYDELLLQSIISAGLPRVSTLKDQAIVAAQHRGACESEHAEPCETGRLKGPFRFLRSAAQRELVTDNFPVVTINHDREMGPSILAIRDMYHVHRPAVITLIGSTHPAAYVGARRAGSLMDQRLQVAIAEGRMLMNQPAERLDPGRVRCQPSCLAVASRCRPARPISKIRQLRAPRHSTGSPSRVGCLLV